jgi:acyl dehydratase
MVMRMMCDAYLAQAASVGSPGIENLKWLKPVRPGDTISARRTTLDMRASKSKPELGIVNNLWEVFNQKGELVMSMQGHGMFRRRAPGEAAT